MVVSYSTILKFLFSYFSSFSSSKCSVLIPHVFFNPFFFLFQFFFSFPYFHPVHLLHVLCFLLISSFPVFFSLPAFSSSTSFYLTVLSQFVIIILSSSLSSFYLPFSFSPQAVPKTSFTSSSTHPFFTLLLVLLSSPICFSSSSTASAASVTLNSNL